MRTNHLPLLKLLFISLASTLPCRAQSASMTYQGTLTQNDVPATGNHDFEFRLFDQPSGGTQRGATLTVSSVVVNNGQFTTAMDFGLTALDGGGDRWLQIAVRPAGGTGALTTLTPRQPLTSAPYAIKSITAQAMEGGDIRNPAFIGTTGLTPLEFLVNDAAALRIIPSSGAPNLIAGALFNYVVPGVVGATIGGGGSLILPNRVEANYACVPGGINNRASGVYSTAMGSGATASGPASLAAGSDITASGASAVALGASNHATGLATMAVGRDCTASANYAMALGYKNEASGRAALAAGDECIASGGCAMALGNLSQAWHDNSFVWADGQLSIFESTAANQFSVRASGGFRLSNDTALNFGNATRQMINLWNAEYGIGVQSDATYFRSGNDYHWYRSGVHSDTNGEGGAGSSRLMTLSRNGYIGLGTSTPGAHLDVTAGQAIGRFTTTGNVNGAVLVLRNTGANPVSLGAINFESSTGTPGQISYQANHQLAIRVGSTQRMTLDAAGLTVNGTLINTSDRNVKEHFEPVDVRAVLERVAALPVTRWNYKDDAGTVHVGPMAQDFYAAFEVGADDRHIATVDADGVALAAIKGLNDKVESNATGAERRIEKLEAENAALKARLDRMEKMLTSQKRK